MAPGFVHPGHTEFLAELSREKTGKSVLPVMMIASDAVRTVPVTIHIALAQVPQAISTQLIVDTARVTVDGLKQRFGIDKPRLAIAGLNPHAGEGGAMGREDIEIIAPAIAQLRAEGIDAIGPLPADTMFHAKARAGYDAALCMYHDQALIPAKTLAFEDGVNVTLGLPFIRTSPDHGTAFGIAGSGKADPSSFVAALRMAHDMALRAQAAVSGASGQIDTLPPLRDVIERHGLTAKKALGQNFLLDLNLTARIAREAGNSRRRRSARNRPGPRRADAGAAGGRRKCGRHRARRALPAGAGRDRGALSGPAAGRAWRCAEDRYGRARFRPASRSSPTCPTTSRRRC